MYKLAYYRFHEVHTAQGKPPGYDTVRNAEIGHKVTSLKHFREAYTSERWIVRIYEVLPQANMDKKMDSRYQITVSQTVPLKNKVNRPML
jgi:dolichyl-diphosphooligosaccharide--protein glycosyltransferase